MAISKSDSFIYVFSNKSSELGGKSFTKGFVSGADLCVVRYLASLVISRVAMPSSVIEHSVHPPPVLHGGGGGGVEPPTKSSKRGEGLTRSQLLEGVFWEREGDVFQGVVLQFSRKK